MAGNSLSATARTAPGLQGIVIVPRAVAALASRATARRGTHPGVRVTHSATASANTRGSSM